MKTHFGFKQVDSNEKQGLVSGVFSSVASKYDIMNDVMSGGLHRIWKKKMVDSVPLGDNYNLLDLAGGTGDITKRIIARSAKYNKHINITLSDINPEMLHEGKVRSIDENWQTRYGCQLNYQLIDAQQIPFEDNSLDAVTIAFGIRNVPDIPKALAEINRVLKVGGKFICLEFSDVENELFRKLYDFHSFNIIPKMGKLIAGDADSYQYLVESIRMFPKAAKFQNMFADAGFVDNSYTKLTGGIAAIHEGFKC